MKHLYLLVNLSLVTLIAGAQAVNGDMEAWTEVQTFAQPHMGVSTAGSNDLTFYEDGTLGVFAVPSQGRSGHALRIANTGSGDDVQPGYFIIGDTPDRSTAIPLFGGGMAFADPDVSGIRVDLRYDLPQDQPGMIVVQFKKQGQPIGHGNLGIGTSVFYIHGQVDRWTPREFLFDQPLDAQPDQVVVAIASANLLTDDQPFAPEAFIEIDNLEWIGSDVEIIGGDFETWSQPQTVLVPENTVVDIRTTHPRHFRADDAAQGLYALGIQTLSTEAHSGVATFGAKMIDNVLVPTLPIQSDNDLLTFQYRYSAQDDRGVATIHFFAAENIEAGPVFSKSFDLLPTESYQTVEYDFADDIAAQEAAVDLAYIVFRSSKDVAAPQATYPATLVIDEVSLSGASPALSPTTTLTAPKSIVRCHPNPTMGRAIFDFTMSRSGMYRIYNSTGAMIGAYSYPYSSRVVHDLYPLPDGLYYFRFYHGEHYASVPVVKN